MRSLILSLGVATTMLIGSCSQPAANQDSGNATVNQEENLTALGQASVDDPNSMANILQIAIGSADHTTLVAGVQAAEIEHVLVNVGPLTVFAPNNDAFANLPEGALDNLLLPENKGLLGDYLTFHATPGKLFLEDLKDGSQLYMATNEYVDVEVKEDGTYVHGAKIIAGPIVASNGIVYVIDAVMIPTKL